MRHGKCGWASARGTPVVVLMLGLGLAALGPPGRLRGQTGVPRPDHVVLVIEENKSYNAIIGSPSAPYINDLTHRGALFISSYAIRHPSQPNYLALFSGSLHGIGDDSCPHSFTGANLAGALLDGGFTFIGYSESMPRPGYRGCSAGSYERKHNPWVNFVDLPDSVNLPYSSFPTDYNQLPAVAIVVPNQANDMHDGPISRGDAWLQTHLEPYVQWAMTNNSLFILTWDEGHNGSDNRVVTRVEYKPGPRAKQSADFCNPAPSALFSSDRY